jgi:hypothetical protein
LAREFALAPEQSHGPLCDPSAMPPETWPRPSIRAAGMEAPRHVTPQGTDNHGTRVASIRPQAGWGCGPTGEQANRFAVASVHWKADFPVTEPAALPKPARHAAMPSRSRGGLNPHAGNACVRDSWERLCGGHASPIYYAILFFGHFCLSDQRGRWLSNDLLVAIFKSCLCARASAVVCAAQKTLDSMSLRIWNTR